jgi:hypothetical protein
MILFEKGIEVDDTLVESVGGKDAFEFTVLSYIKALLKGSYVRQEEKKAKEQADVMLLEKVKKLEAKTEAEIKPDIDTKGVIDDEQL